MFYVYVTEIGSVGIELATDVQAYRYFLNPTFKGLWDFKDMFKEKTQKFIFVRLLYFLYTIWYKSTS